LRDEILDLKTRSGDVEFKWHATLRMPVDWKVTMKFDSLLATAVFLAGILVGSLASAQSGFNGAGGWSCSVVLTERGLQPYGYQADIYAQPDGSLFANGAVYDPNLMQSVVPFQARGDWAVFPSANGLHVRLRAHTSTHGILVFEGYATSSTRIYVVAPLNSGGQAESQCTRIR
jgi:hypothetical protein